MELKYEQIGDYLFPMLEMDPQPEGELTKFGLMRWEFLKEHRNGSFQAMTLECSLFGHCLEIQKQAEERMDTLILQLKESRGITESLKEKDQLLWVQEMNSIRQAAEETVLTELIYS